MSPLIPLRQWSTLLPEVPLRPVATEAVVGRRCGAGRSGGKSLWWDPDAGAPLGVEALVLQGYRRDGWDGRHAESGLVRALFALLLWDALFDDAVPDVFQSRFQAAPLDLGTAHFHAARRSHLDRRLQGIAAQDGGALRAEVAAAWADRRGHACVGLGPATDAAALDHLLECLPPAAVAGLLTELAHHYAASGFPDLTLWHPAHAPAGAALTTSPRRAGGVQASGAP